MNRRHFLYILGSIPLTLSAPKIFGGGTASSAETKQSAIEKIVKSDMEWRQQLTPAQYNILRQEGTERSFSSPLNDEKRHGTYHCAGCELPLFTSKMKFDSGTGWPSFFTSLPNHTETRTDFKLIIPRTETRTDFKLIIPRTEYHCTRCGGHQGHVFNDGPEPTGERWCNNGLALKFIPA